MEQAAPIGIFDSGIGGLTVVKELRRLLPNENLIYVGDTARVPYGSREPAEILSFMKQTLNFLESHKVKIAVFACNTMTTYGLKLARQKYNFWVIPMNSGISVAASLSSSRKIGVIATHGTVENEMHRKAAEAMDIPVAIYAKACPEFVPLIENGQITGAKLELAAEKSLQFFQGSGVDSLILGCTHYPLISNIIQKYVGENVHLVNPALATAQDTVDYLKSVGQLNDSNQPGNLKFYFSADLERARRMVKLVLNTNKAEFRQVDLTQYQESV